MSSSILRSNKLKAVSIVCLTLLTLPLSTYAWTIHKSFESGEIGSRADTGDSGFTGDAGGAEFTNEVSALGQQSAKLKVRGGTTGFGYWGGTLNFPSELSRGDEVWISVRLFIPDDFEITTNTGSLKFLRVRQKNSDGSHTGYLDNLIRMPNQTNGVFTLLKEGQHQLFHYGQRGEDDLPRGRWFRYELYAYLDATPRNQGGQAQVRAWMNDKLLTEENGIYTLSGNNVTATALYLFTYWNGEAPKSQHLFVDDIVITNETPPNRDSLNNPMIGSWPGEGGGGGAGTAPPRSPDLEVR